MSSIRKKVYWIINSEDIQVGRSIMKNLGPALGDNWTIELQPMSGSRGELIFRREKAAFDTYCHLKFLFKSSETRRKEDVKRTFMKRFQHSCDSEITWFLNNYACKLIYGAKVLKIDIDMELYLAPNQDIIIEQTFSSSQQALCNLSVDLSTLCCNNLLSDVILRCESKVFPAHKLILSARCPVFAEKLKHKTSEDVKLDIDDISSDVLKTVLLFIYSGKAEIKALESARDIINAANIYQLNELKQLCENYIQNISFTENVSETNCSSHNTDEVRSGIQKFKCDNSSEENFLKNFKEEI